MLTKNSMNFKNMSRTELIEECETMENNIRNLKEEIEELETIQDFETNDLEEIDATLDLVNYCLARMKEADGGYYKSMAIQMLKYCQELLAKS